MWYDNFLLAKEVYILVIEILKEIAPTHVQYDPSNHDYSYKVKHHSGINKYRIQQTDFTGRPNSSIAVQYKSNVMELSFSPAKASKDVYFQTPDKKAAESMFEIYDSYGNLVKKGFDKQVDVSGLAKGVYYLNYDNKTQNFIKK